MCGIPNVSKLDLIDKPIVPTPYSAPDLSEELMLISEADAAAALERQRLRDAAELQRVIEESAEMQVHDQIQCLLISDPIPSQEMLF